MSEDSETDLAGQDAVVAGGGRGIGRAIALKLAAAGAAVAVVARTEQQIQQRRSRSCPASVPAWRCRTRARRLPSARGRIASRGV
jgi:NAD(P)-dependent dehydrogenase (short-subunit alcohol dehydrogenase family)